MNLSKYAKRQPTVEECDELQVKIYSMMGYRFPNDVDQDNKDGWLAFGKVIKTVKEMFKESNEHPFPIWIGPDDNEKEAGMTMNDYWNGKPYLGYLFGMINVLVVAVLFYGTLIALILKIADWLTA